MRRADARSAQIGSPDGISQRFQVSAYSGEPFTSKRACNLFSKDDWRIALGDEPVELWPKVPFVLFSLPFACAAKWLAGARSCPNRAICWPPGKAESFRPSADSGEEMTLSVSFEV
jgi:hypothetical protein